MEDALISPYLLALIFFFVAFAYSSVGLGGGSSYTALMAIFGLNAVSIPTITLTLNIFVTSIGSFNFIRRKHARFGLIFPFFISSIPMAYLGGALRLPKTLFYWLLLISLIFVAARIYLWGDMKIRLNVGRLGRVVISLIAGAVLGLVAGIVGIGGGIYLIPLIIILGLGSEKEAAACGSIFICVNSISGLTSRLQYNLIDLTEIISLIIAVVAGGALGSFLGSSRYNPKTMQKILGGIIIVAILFLFRKVLTT